MYRCELDTTGRGGSDAGLILVTLLQPRGQPQHGAAECLGATRGIVHRPRHQNAISPKPAAGHEETVRPPRPTAS